MTFARLRRSEAIAAIAALALLLVMAMDWYSTREGEEARRIERIEEPSGAQAGEVSRQVEEDARIIAEKAEKNAWQANEAIDRVILVALLAAAFAALAAAALRASGRVFSPPGKPSGVAAAIGLLATILVCYRIIQKPGVDEAAVVKAGAPLGLLCVGLLALASRIASRLGPPEEPGAEPEGEAEAESAAEESRPPATEAPAPPAS